MSFVYLLMLNKMFSSKDEDRVEEADYSNENYKLFNSASLLPKNTFVENYMARRSYFRNRNIKKQFIKISNDRNLYLLILVLCCPKDKLLEDGIWGSKEDQ